MRVLQDTHIDFLEYRRFFVILSILLMALGLGAVVLGKLRLGIDFAGGTQLTVRFRDEPNVERVRRVLADAGEQASIQRFRDGRNEILITLPLDPQGIEGQGARIVEILEGGFHPDAGSRLDLNRAGRDAVAGLLESRDPESRRSAEDPQAASLHYAEVADAVVEHRRRSGLVAGFDELAAAGVDPASIEALRDAAYLGSFRVVGQESVGPQIGSELRTKGVLAVVLSMAGMLTYIAYRFRFPFGVGAVVASLHDVLVTLGLFAVAGFEFNLTTVAALLTLIGYSVNDTVVIFDRMRENRRLYPRQPLYQLMNRSLNETLSRTVLTSATTLMVTLSLLFLGGQVLGGFSFLLTIGVVAGTYSTIYVASPIALFLEERADRRRAVGGHGGTAAGRGLPRDRAAA